MYHMLSSSASICCYFESPSRSLSSAARASAAWVLSVVVDAKTGAADFYRMLGFRPLTTVDGVLGDRLELLPTFLAIRHIAEATA